VRAIAPLGPHQDRGPPSAFGTAHDRPRLLRVGFRPSNRFHSDGRLTASPTGKSLDQGAPDRGFGGRPACNSKVRPECRGAQRPGLGDSSPGPTACQVTSRQTSSPAGLGLFAATAGRKRAARSDSSGVQPDAVDRPLGSGGQGWMGGPPTNVLGGPTPKRSDSPAWPPEHRSRPGPLQQVWRGARRRGRADQRRKGRLQTMACHQRNGLATEGRPLPKERAWSTESGLSRRTAPQRQACHQRAAYGQKLGLSPLRSAKRGRPPLLTWPGSQTWLAPKRGLVKQRRFPVGGFSVGGFAKSKALRRPASRRLVCAGIGPRRHPPSPDHRPGGRPCRRQHAWSGSIPQRPLSRLPADPP